MLRMDNPHKLRVALTETQTVAVVTRHATDCPKTNRLENRCKCRKSIYVYSNGKDRLISAKTRSKQVAETKAGALRQAMDPLEVAKGKVEALKRKLKGELLEKDAERMTLDAALDRWLASIKQKSRGTQTAYKTAIKKMKSWGVRKEIVYLADVAPDALDEWRGEWGLDALLKDDRLGASAQSMHLQRIKRFFAYGTRMKWIASDPAAGLEAIEPESKETLPLSRVQFDELLAATYVYDEKERREPEKLGSYLRALFLLMRWSGLRLGDAAAVSKKQMTGSRLRLKTQKTQIDVSIILPDVVLDAFRSLPSWDEEGNYYFWTGSSSHLSLSCMWARKVKQLAPLLKFKNDDGKPVSFHSHLLRDTFAVEHLLSGTSLEDLSKMLGHASVRVTEKYYAPWVRARQDRPDQRSIEALMRMGQTVSG